MLSPPAWIKGVGGRAIEVIRCDLRKLPFESGVVAKAYGLFCHLSAG